MLRSLVSNPVIQFACTMGTNGVITNASDDFKISASGVDLAGTQTGFGQSRTVDFYDDNAYTNRVAGIRGFGSSSTLYTLELNGIDVVDLTTDGNTQFSINNDSFVSRLSYVDSFRITNSNGARIFEVDDGFVKLDEDTGTPATDSNATALFTTFDGTDHFLQAKFPDGTTKIIADSS